MTTPVPDEVIQRLKLAVGPKGWIEAEADKQAYLVDARELYHGATPLVLRPGSVAEVAAVVGICAGAGVGVVPQGGNTGYCGGATPDQSGGEILLSTSRLNRVRALDPLNYTITVEAGCILAHIQQAAEEADRLFPLSLAAEGSCQIGGNLSTNAGGIAVLRYGNARDLALGLEVVLPDGQVWDGLTALRKDNTGYDLKQLFLGAEGTLGVITAATLKLFPRPRDLMTAFVALPDAEAALRLLARMRSASSDGITSFEYLNRSCLDIVTAHIADTTDPFAEPYEHYALIELAAGREASGLAEAAEAALAEAFEAAEVLDATIAQSGQQAKALWRLRETIPEAQKLAGAGMKHDVSVPLSSVPAFLGQAIAAVEEMIPGVVAIPFGHMGDGNVHFNLVQPAHADPEEFLARTHEVEARVHDIADALDGSFSAEHGVGVLKKGELGRYKSPVELELMATVKRTLDPKGIMNPGKIL